MSSALREQWRRRKVVEMVAKGTWILVLLTGAVLLSPPAAQATVPGKDGLIVYSSAGGDLFSMNPDGTNKHRLMRTSAGEWGPAFAPCGCRLAYVSSVNGHDDIYVMNLDGTGRFRLLAWTSNERNPTWSPDGTKIAFSSNHDGNAEIYVVAATKVHPAPKQMTHTSGRFDFNDQPDWSPDGSRIVFVYDWNIWTMNASTGFGKKMLNIDPCLPSWPSWSPDGTRIAVSGGNSCGSNDYDQIWINWLDGVTTAVPVTPNDLMRDDPEWSPSGTRIVFSSDAGIQSVKADGTGLLKLTFTYGDSGPTWQPLH